MNGHGAVNNNVAGQYQKVATGRAYIFPREHNGNKRLESNSTGGFSAGGRHQTLPGSGPNVTVSPARSFPGEGPTSQQINNRSTDQHQQGAANTKACHSQVSVQS
ncbi:hypothetical protein TEQG_06891 [Trichophyton equinum CBS 127.97]|uniref:Uncharacterized protein n=1 Tax=Trichophyton equinum (strain ATCC MYA-4606 / CBS 127.97) TaxID=559882 RepID=F2Q1X2_TRIEC|nr:hypothetical protein TEQG_06891 [Trichophyton equinum CBS 127.97]